MKTIGRRWPRDQAPRGDYIRRCDVCGVRWRRSQLTRMPWGLLACPDDNTDRHYAAPPHVLNDDGTGSPHGGPADQLPVDDPLVYLL